VESSFYDIITLFTLAKLFLVGGLDDDDNALIGIRKYA
jgi:hypothetical protein